MTTKILKLTGFDKLKLTATVVKAVTGVIGGSLVLTETHPYLSLTVLGIGAASNEILGYLRDQQGK